MAGRLSLRHKLALAWAALAVQLLWPLSLPVLGLINLLAAFGLYDGPAHLPPWAHLSVLGAAVIALVVSLRRRPINWPTMAQAARRLERDSGLGHQPLAVLSDRPVAGGDPVLWQEHCRRMAALTERMRPSWPRFDLLRQDRWGLRFWIWVPLGLGLVVGHQDIPGRLSAGFWPQWGPGPQVRAWVTPPPATGLAPFVLTGSRVAIPVGSRLQASVSLDWGRAVLLLDGHEQSFDGAQDQSVDAIVANPKHIAVRRWGLVLAEWQVDNVADQPPQVAFSHDPQSNEEQGWEQVGLTASDDYGLARIWLNVESPLGPPTEIPMAGERRQPGTSHVERRMGNDEGGLAGMPVTLTPMAQDSAGQQARGASFHLRWPQRPFHDPVAQELAALRQSLLDGAAPAAVAERLAGIAENLPDLTAALALGVARRDLTMSDADTAEAQRLILQTANHQEDQAQAAAAAQLRRMGQQLDAMPAGSARAQLARLYARMLGNMLDHPDGAPGALPLGRQELAAMLARLDRLADNDGEIRQLAEKLARRLGAQGNPLGPAQAGAGADDDGTTLLPSGMDTDAAGQILRNIRTRVLDPDRPQDERAYLKRLLDR